MSKILIPILIGVAASATIIILSLANRKRLAGLAGRLKSGNFIGLFNLSNLINRSAKAPISRKTNPEPSVEESAELDLSILNCRVKLSQYKDGNCTSDAFEIEICGSIHTPREVPSATMKISISDITDSKSEACPVNALVKQWRAPDSDVFCYNARLGKLPHQITTMPDWTSIAILRLDWLELARKGKRNLKFEVSILSDDLGDRLAGASCNYGYDNQCFGYLDLKDNKERSRTLAIALAFAVSAANGKLEDCEIEYIKNWTKENIELSERTKKERRKLDKAFKETIAFFRSGKKLNYYDICREVVEIAIVDDRCDFVNLFLHVAQANGKISEQELNLLRDFADWLGIDDEKFRDMVQKILPIEMYEVKDIETILGVTADMNKEKARRHLNREYSKWSARVTNTDPEIQSQADQMLKLIAEARSQYIG